MKKPKEWEKIIANETTDKGEISKLHKQFLQLISRKTNTTIKRWAEDLNRHLSKDKWLKNTWKDAQHHSLLEKCKPKLKYHLTQVRVATIKKSTYNKCWRGCGEKGTLLHYCNVSWYSNHGRQYRDSLKKLEIKLFCVLLLRSCPTLCDPMDCSPPGSSVQEFSRQEYSVGCHALLQGIFLTQGSNLHLLWLLNCRQIFFFTTESLWKPKTNIWPSKPTTGHVPQESHNWKRHMYRSDYCITIYNS